MWTPKREGKPFLPRVWKDLAHCVWVSHTLGGFVIILGVIYFRRFVGGFVMILGVIYFRRFVNAILGLTKLFWKKRKQRWVSRSLGLPDNWQNVQNKSKNNNFRAIFSRRRQISFIFNFANFNTAMVFLAVHYYWFNIANCGSISECQTYKKWNHDLHFWCQNRNIFLETPPFWKTRKKSYKYQKTKQWTRKDYSWACCAETGC